MIDFKKILLYVIVPSLPIIQMVTTAWSAIFILNFNSGDTIGYSISTGLVYFALFYYKYDGKNAFIYWISSIGLILMNIISWLGSLIYADSYGKVYDISVFFIVLVTTLSMWFYKRKEDRKYIKITPK